MLKLSFLDMCLKINNSILQPNLPGANELSAKRVHVISRDIGYCPYTLIEWLNQPWTDASSIGFSGEQNEQTPILFKI